MKISVQDGGIVDFFGVEKGYKMIAEAGFEGIDWNINNDAPGQYIRNGTICGNTIFEKPLDEVLAYYKPKIDEIKKNGLEISQAHAPFPSWTPEHPEVLDEMIEIQKRCIELCDAVGCKYLVIHGVTLTEIDSENTPESIEAVNIKLYESLIPTLLKHNVTVCLENLFSSKGCLIEGCCSNPHEAVKYIDTLNQKAGREVFGLCLDTGHLSLLRKNFRSYIKTVGNRIKALHLHDNDAVSDAHLMPFTGVIDWNYFCNSMKEIGYDGDLSFETFAQARRVEKFDPELVPELLRWICLNGKSFKKKIEA